MEIYIEISGKNDEIFLDKAGWLTFGTPSYFCKHCVSNQIRLISLKKICESRRKKTWTES